MANKCIEKAIAALLREQELMELGKIASGFGKNILSRIILHLSRGDFVAARNTHLDAIGRPEYNSCGEFQACEALVGAYEDNDEEELIAALKMHSIKRLEREIYEYSQKLKGSQGSRNNKSKETNTHTPTVVANPVPPQSTMAEDVAGAAGSSVSIQSGPPPESEESDDEDL